MRLKFDQTRHEDEEIGTTMSLNVPLIKIWLTSTVVPPPLRGAESLVLVPGLVKFQPRVDRPFFRPTRFRRGSTQETNMADSVR